MEAISFNDLPNAVAKLYLKLTEIEQLLLTKISDSIPESDQFLTIKEASSLLNLSVPTIYGLVSKAQLPTNKRGKRLYFSKQELSAWIKEGRKKTTSEINIEAKNHQTRRKG